MNRKKTGAKFEAIESILSDELSPLFWQSELLDYPSAWFGHVPFAHWIVLLAEPEVLVELGTHAGVSYSAFCEAVSRIHVNTRCFAVDTWKGDEQAGYYSEKVYQNLHRFNMERYGSFSTLLRMTFDDAIAHVPDNSVDILHIDGFHSYEAVSHDFKTWQSKLSKRGVVLFHDTNERKEGFGVWRFWSEISRQYPSFEFLHSHGLGVLCVGEEAPDEIVRLCRLNESESRRVRERFQFLGDRWRVEAQLRRQIADSSEHAGQMKQQYNQLLLQMEQYKHERGARAGEAAELSAKLSDYERRYEASVSVANSQGLEIDELKAALERARSVEQDTSRRLAEAQSQLADATAQAVDQAVKAGPAVRSASDSPSHFLGLTRVPGMIARWLSPPAARSDRRHLRRQRRTIHASELFDADWYLNQYEDVTRTGVDPVLHYLLHGATEGRNPSPLFDSHEYLAHSPDVAASGINPLYHYIVRGKAENRFAPKARLAGLAGSVTARPALSRTRQVAEQVDSREIIEAKVMINRYRRYSRWDVEREREFLERIDRLYQASPARIDGMTVSIIMPTFDRSAAITPAIESVLDQTHQNWRLIIVDDGSTDDTESVVEKYLTDPRIVYLYQENTGVSSARNYGLSHVHGDYVFYLDSDNSWKNNHLRTLLVFMDSCNLAAAYSGLECADDDGAAQFYRGAKFLWEACEEQNYIDLNCFAHRADLAKVFHFDTSIKRLVDWDLILNITRLHRTAFAPYLGVNYYNGLKGNRITFTEYTNGELPTMQAAIREKYQVTWEQLETIRKLHPDDDEIDALLDRNGKDATEGAAVPIRIGYVVWDWPALSQSFVVNEVRWLTQNGFDVRVYYKIDPDRPVELDFKVAAFKVEGVEDLKGLVVEHGRTVLHSPFAYPATSLLTWPVAEAVGIPFTFMPGGVDISHFENRKRNRVGEVASSDNCVGVITLGTYHKDFLIEQGVPTNRIVMERQAVGLPAFRCRPERSDSAFRIVAIGRFVEKKGFKYLIQAAAKLRDAEIVIYGYGPEEQALRGLISEVGAANATLAGELPNNQALHDAYYDADLFVLPCVQAANGDLDGLPTVLMEAMAAGTPVLTTRIANIPDLIQDGVTGFLVSPNDSESIVEGVRRIRKLPKDRLEQLIEDASNQVRAYASIDRTMTTLLQCWKRRPIDIFLVTYDTEKYANLEDTIEIIDRIYKFTSMPFNLIVVDNNSQDEFRRVLSAKFSDRTNFSLFQLPVNTMCGPASNVALAAGISDYAIYICSKEGFLLRHGWELEVVSAMDANPNAAIGGHLLSLPRYATGKQIQEYPSFENWRNKEYAMQHPDRTISHVQGGFFILRRQAYMDAGGFNEAVPHNGMDVEYSYYLASKGYDLLQLDRIAAISNKTRPELFSIVDDKTLFVHPSSHREVARFDRLANSQTRHCVCCGWQGASFNLSFHNDTEECPACGTDSFTRSVWRHLSRAGLLQARPSAFVVSSSDGLEKALGTICKTVARMAPSPEGSIAATLARFRTEMVAPGVVILDHLNWSGNDAAIVGAVRQFVNDGHLAVIGAPSDGGSTAAFEDLLAGGGNGRSIRFLSEAGAFDWRPIAILHK